MNVLRNILKNHFLLLAQYVVGGLVPLLLTPHIVREIGLEGFGRIAVLLSWSAIGASIASFATDITGPLHFTARRTVAEQSDLVLTVFLAKAVMQLVLIAPLLAAFSVVSFGLHDLTFAEFFLLFSGPIGSVLNSSWLLQVRGKFGSIALLSVFVSLLLLWAGLRLVDGGTSYAYTAAVLLSGSGAFLVGVATFALSPPRYQIFRGWNLAREVWNFIRASYPFFISQVAALLYTRTGPIFVDLFLGVKSAGLFSAIDRPVSVVTAALTLIHTAAFPRLLSLFQEDKDKHAKTILQIVVLYLVTAMLIAVALWINRGIVLSHLVGSDTAEAQQILLLSLLLMILGVFGPAATGYLAASGRSNEVLPLTMRVLMTSVVLGIVLLQFLSAIGWLLGLILGQIWVLTYFVRLLKGKLALR